MNTSRFLTLMLVVTVPLHAQDVGLYAAAVLPRSSHESAVPGVGMSVGTTFRLGDIFHESVSWSRSTLRIGLRLSASETHSAAFDYARCADDCPPEAHLLDRRLRIVEGAALVYPYHTRATQVELTGGAALYAHRETPRLAGVATRHRQWGFRVGAGLARRLRVQRPLWVQVGYAVHGRALLEGELADGGTRTPPAHSVRLGLAYRFEPER